MVLGAVPASAQDFSAGKTPAQLFAGDCAACHRSPQGLGRGRDASSLTSFLREHYTTKPANAGALASYLVSLSGGSGAVRRPSSGSEEPRSGTRQKPAADGAPKPEEQPAPRRTPRSATGEDDKAAEAAPPRPRSRAEEPKPQAGEAEAPARRIATPTAEPGAPGARVRERPMTPSERLKSYSSSGDNAKAAEDQQGEAKASTATRLGGYATSGADADAVSRSAGTEAGQDGRTGKSRKRNRAAEAPQGETAPAPAANPAAGEEKK